MILSLIVIGGTLAFLVWLVFTFAVYALPCFVAVSAAMLAYASGAGVLGAGIVGLVAGTLIVAIGQTALANARSPVVRAVILAVYIVPAGLAGFGIARDVASLVVPGQAWRTVFAILGAVVTMGTAFARRTQMHGRDELRHPPAALPLVARRQ